MGYNGQKIEMKKLLISATLIIGMVAGAMMLSAFTTPKQEANAKCSVTENQEWQVLKYNVAFCSSDSSCEGYGSICKNTRTGQLGFKISSMKGGDNVPDAYIDLTPSSALDGYNYRFYYKGYHYVYY